VATQQAAAIELAPLPARFDVFGCGEQAAPGVIADADGGSRWLVVMPISLPAKLPEYRQFRALGCNPARSLAEAQNRR
jgi:hypothetical protein